MASVKKVAECVQRLVDLHGLGTKEAQSIIDEVVKRRDKMGRQFDEQELADALTAMALNDLAETRRKVLNNKRARVLGVMKTKEVGAIIKGFTDSGMSLKKAWSTFLLGGSDWLDGTLNSVAQTRLGLERLFLGKFAVWSRNNPQLLKLMKKEDAGGNLDRALADALINNKYEGGPMNELAGLMAESLEGFRVAANDAGLDIGRFQDEGYIPHRYDREKMLKAGREKFREVVMRTADLERTYGKMDNYSKAIDETYEAIIGNQAEYFDGAAFIKTRKGANLEKHREIHFDGARGWTSFAAEFGQGNVWDGVMNYLESGVRQLAVIQRLGPRPEETIGRLVDGIKVTDEKTLKFKNENNSKNFNTRDGDLGRMYRVVSGEDLVPDSYSIAKTASMLRSVQSLAKLGGATLSAFADLPVAAMRLKTNHGMGLMEAWQTNVSNFFAKIPTGQRQEMGYVFDAICEGIQGDMAQRFDLENPMSDKMNKLMRWFFKWNGLTPWTDAMKTGAYMGIASNIGFHSKKSFNDLSLELQKTLGMYGLADRWDVIRLSLVRKIGDKEYLCPELARQLDDDLVDKLTEAEWGEVLIDNRRQNFDYFSGDSMSRHYNFLSTEMKTILGRHNIDQPRWEFILENLRARDVDGKSFIDMDRIDRLPDEAVDQVTRERWQTMEESLGLENSTATAEGLVELKANLREEYKAGLRKNLEEAMEETILQPQDVLKEKLRREYKNNLEADLAGFLSSEVNKAVLTPDERNRYALLRGTRPGTAAGEAVRSVMQFKSFPTLFIQQVLKPIWASRRVEGIGNRGMLSNLGLMMAQTTLFGGVAMEAKRLARGEKPYALSENPDWAAALGAAFVQGGGAGLYGDFLLGEYNRFGQSALESAAGPIAGTANDIFKLFGKTRSSVAGLAGLSDETGLKAADVLKFAQNNTPGLNIWYAKLALEWAFLWDLQELVSPGTQARRMKRARKEGREYWLSPKDDRARPFTN